MRSSLLAAGLALALVAHPAAADSPVLISEVAFDTDGPVDAAEVSRLLEVRGGEPFDADAVRRSVQNLYATERYSDVRVESETAGEGRIDLLFHLFHAFRVDPLHFEGSPLPADELRRALGFSTGEPYREPDVNDGIDRLSRLLATEGYADARVEPVVSFDKSRFTADVLYRLHAGPVTRAGKPIFDGDPAPFAERELLAQMRVSPGVRFRESRARRDAERIQKFLLEKGRLKAEVRLIGVDRENKAASPVYRIEVGPEVVLEVRGAADERVRKDFLDLLKNQTFEEDLLTSYVAARRKAYQEQGYRDAKVDYAIQRAPGLIRVSLTVDRGLRQWIERIRLSGVNGFSEDRIRSLLLTSSRSTFSRGRFVDEVVDADRRAIEGFYLAHGYTQVDVAEPEVVPGARPGAIEITLEIHEGVRTVVSGVTIDGAKHSVPHELESLLQVHDGSMLDLQALEEDRARLTNHYRDDGWTGASVETRVEYSSDRAAAAVIFVIVEGSREFVGKTIVRGNTRTRTDRLLIPLHFHEGDPFSESQMLESQRDLARTGVFQKVEVRRAPPEPGRVDQNVLVDVVEGRPLSLLYGVGYQYDDQTGDSGPFGILGVGYNNLFGSLRSMSLETRYAPFSDQGRVFLNYRDPYLLGAAIPVTATIFYAREPIQNVDIQRRGAFVQASRQIDTRTRVGLRYEFQRIKVENTNPLDLVQLQPFDRNIAESTVGATVLYDVRDDPIEPHSGAFLNAFAKDAFPMSFLSADANYFKAYGQVSGYLPLLGGVLAGSVRAGTIAVSSACRENFNDCIPIAERFFSGGRTSNRGFSPNIEGIPGQTVDYSVIQTPASVPGNGNCDRASIDPGRLYDCSFSPRLIGGSSTAGWNAEWRFPIAGDFGGTLFYDATQVWDDGRIRFRVEGAEGLRQSVGVGLRFRTAVGPLLLEYGKVVHTRSFSVPVLRQDPITKQVYDTGLQTRQEEAGYQIFLSIGYPF